MEVFFLLLFDEILSCDIDELLVIVFMLIVVEVVEENIVLFVNYVFEDYLIFIEIVDEKWIIFVEVYCESF